MKRRMRWSTGRDVHLFRWIYIDNGTVTFFSRCDTVPGTVAPVTTKYDRASRALAVGLSPIFNAPLIPL